MMSAPDNALSKPGATGWAGCPWRKVSGRSVRSRRPLGSRRWPGRGPKVTSSQSTSRANARASSSGYRSPPPNNPSVPNAVGATCMTRILTIALLTLGDPGRLTGGYLYHQRLVQLAPRHGSRIEFVSFPDRPFPLAALHAPAVLRRARALGAGVLVLDSIAAAFLGPWLTLRPPTVPLVGMLHQPPGGIDHGPIRTAVQARLDRLAYHHARRLLVASESLADALRADGVPSAQLGVVPPGRDVAATVGPSPGDLRHGRQAALLCVANWVERKGLHSLLDAFARLLSDVATLHL